LIFDERGDAPELGSSAHSAPKPLSPPSGNMPGCLADVTEFVKDQ
jgi:hypothetical protein